MLDLLVLIISQHVLDINLDLWLVFMFTYFIVIQNIDHFIIIICPSGSFWLKSLNLD